MSQNTFGVACKTCRRRARKCDRRLPKCMNCSLRGSVCEGYALRWVNAAVDRQNIADQTPRTPNQEINILLPAPLRPRNNATTTKTRTVVKFVRSQRQKRPTSNTGPPLHNDITDSSRPIVQDTKFRDLWDLQQQALIAPMAMKMMVDDLENLVKYCKK